MINLQQIKRSIFVLIVVISGLVSCGRQPVYNEFNLIDIAGWSVDSTSVFQINMEDTSGVYDLTLHVRHTSAYPYQNLWLFVEQLSPDSQLVRDTISCTLADHTGKWLGTGSGSVYLYSVPLKMQNRFDKPGSYHFGVVHGMRDEILTGIQAVGLRLENHHGKK
jgi:gliding motility-associated lipoprotein GldH